MTKYFRHRDSDLWFRLSDRVKKRREIDTPWGPAMAEVGTFIATLKGDPKHKIICTQDDLENYWTDEPVPDLPEPEPWVSSSSEEAPLTPIWLPGMKEPKNGT